MKHTPGPWKISKETTKGQFVTETHIRAENDWHIALIGPCQVDENARLIAAAPDLLEALERARYGLSNFISQRDKLVLISDIESAIAKARSES